MDLSAAGSSDDLALCSEELFETITSGGTPDDAQLADAVAQRELFPCFFGSALKLEGVAEFLEGLEQYAPVPAYPAESGRKTIWIDGRPYGYTDLGESGKGAKPRREREKMSYIGVYTPRNNNQAFVFGVLHGLLNRGMLDEKTVQDLCSPAWCKRVLQMHSLFPMLLPVSRLAASGYESVRFYKKERLEVGGKEYLVCSQWYPDNIRALKKKKEKKLGG